MFILIYLPWRWKKSLEPSPSLLETLERYSSLSESSFRINENPMKEFEGQHLVNLEGVVSVSFEVSLNNSLESMRLEIGPGKAARIEEHISNIARKRIPIPDAKVVELVPAEEQVFKAQGREQVIESEQPTGACRSRRRIPP